VLAARGPTGPLAVFACICSALARRRPIRLLLRATDVYPALTFGHAVGVATDVGTDGGPRSVTRVGHVWLLEPGNLLIAQ
jgi:hypothetical protein